MITIKFKPLVPDARIPTRGTPYAAAYDLYAINDSSVLRGDRVIIHTGIAVEIPHGYYGQIETRSGFAFRGLIVSGGIIDSDYRGELKVILHNAVGADVESFEAGDRVAQLIIHPVVQSQIVEVSDLSATDRGEAGFGSTGR